MQMVQTTQTVRSSIFNLFVKLHSSSRILEFEQGDISPWFEWR